MYTVSRWQDLWTNQGLIPLVLCISYNASSITELIKMLCEMSLKGTISGDFSFIKHLPPGHWFCALKHFEIASNSPRFYPFNFAEDTAKSLLIPMRQLFKLLQALTFLKNSFNHCPLCIKYTAKGFGGPALKFWVALGKILTPWSHWHRRVHFEFEDKKNWG